MRSTRTTGTVAGLAFASVTLAAPAALDRYDVVWHSPSRDAAGSMPIGNGEVVVNVWVEADSGDLMLLVGRSDAWSELGRYLKIGRIRVQLTPSPFLGADFRQRLRLRDGMVQLSGQGERLTLFVDSDRHVVHLRGNLRTPRRIRATVESWRRDPRPLPAVDEPSAWSVQKAPFPLVESADVFRSGPSDVTWFHRNETSVVPALLELQGLTGAPGAFDPLLHRTFGGRLEGAGLKRSGPERLESPEAVRSVELRLATHSAQVPQVDDWLRALPGLLAESPGAAAERRTRAWWRQFWGRSWVFVEGDTASSAVPINSHPLRRGVDSNGGNRFPGVILAWEVLPKPFSGGKTVRDMAPAEAATVSTENGFTLRARVRVDRAEPGRIFDRLTAGREDGYLFDTHPGRNLRLIVGAFELVAPGVLELGREHLVTASYDAQTGAARITVDGRTVAERRPDRGFLVTRGYILQRYAFGFQGRASSPIKFNGGFFTVEPTAMGIESNPDFRRWGDPHWFQNVRHTVHPMPASGDTDLMESFFGLYERVRPLAESRTRIYHNAEGAYFPETMTVYGLYSGNDYGWDRTGRHPRGVESPWWRYAWNQGPELVALMLDRWDHTRDESFLRERVLPMAESTLRYFDTRFRKDAQGKIVIDPAQVVETYWEGVVNDAPTVAGLIAVTERLTKLPPALVSADRREFFARVAKAVPALPLEVRDGVRELAPAERYVPKTSNVENGELYGVWPFRLVSLSRPALLDEARRAYADRKNRLDTGWGYDGNVAALLGMTDEAARILNVKVRNSHPAYRWPATWGPNFDWLPDQNHGGNLLNQTQLMLLQAEPLEQGGAIRVLPAWPKGWAVKFKLHAPGNTTVELEAQGGVIRRLEVSPADRRKDVVFPEGWTRPN